MVIESAGFLEVAFSSSDPARGVDLQASLGRLLDEPLAQAQVAGTVDPALGTDDVLLVLRMVFGAIHTEPDLEARRHTTHQVLGLVGRGLSWNHGSTKPAL